ncbi:polymerase delta-interacting protein 3-like, partial [Polyodon spathula]|uniref:polymerase delta-interacting protein 3-like n=1 Tax=Polyodon spathula TaxID=7913 RepID=UPI001B7DBFE7
MSLSLGEDGSSKQMKITTANDLAPIRPGVSGPRFSLSKTAPLTKVFQNDSYTASPPAPSPPPPLPSPPPSSSSSILRSKPSLVGASRTLVQQTGGAGAVQKAAETRVQRLSAPQQPAAQLSVFSPLEGTKMTVDNLHPRVTEEDIVELFCVCGALKRAKLVRAGFGEVVFVKQEDAVSAYRKYNNRCLDGQPMKCNLHLQGGSVITSDQPILLRLSDAPGLPKKAPSTADLRQGAPRPPSRLQGEVDPETVLRALFKSSGTPTASTQPT